MEDLAAALPVFAFFSRFFRFGSQGRDGSACDGFSMTTTGVCFRFGHWFGGSFTRTLVFATGFFLAGVFVAMTDPTPGVKVE